MLSQVGNYWEFKAGSQLHLVGSHAGIGGILPYIFTWEVGSNSEGNTQEFFLGAVNSCDEFEELWNVVTRQ